MMNYVITAKCENGHEQNITISGDLGRQWADAQAGLLDGTSGMYLYPPIGTDSVIGKCGICKAQIECSVTESYPDMEDQR